MDAAVVLELQVQAVARVGLQVGLELHPVLLGGMHVQEREIALAQSGGAVALTYALVVATGLVGVVINLVVRAVERRVLSWHPSVRGEAAA